MLKLIEDKCFSIDYLNYQLSTINVDFESSNVPPEITIDYLKKNLKLKMSSSETVFFTRYFGILIGDQVPCENEIWTLYTKLREIIHIVTSPIMTKSRILQLELLITEHHKLYLKHFGELKAKFHIILHYMKLILKNGPLIKLSVIRFKSKHRELKAIAQAMCSRKNILLSIALRHKLSKMHLQFSRYEDMYITYGTKIEKNISVDTYFPKAKVKCALNSVAINDVTYRAQTVIITDVNDDGLQFGQISAVYFVDDKIYFKYVPFQTIGFNLHYFAHTVLENADNEKLIANDLLVTRTPCLISKKDDVTLIATRHVL